MVTPEIGFYNFFCYVLLNISVSQHYKFYCIIYCVLVYTYVGSNLTIYCHWIFGNSMISFYSQFLII